VQSPAPVLFGCGSQECWRPAAHCPSPAAFCRMPW
jgi:hypothetical protein